MSEHDSVIEARDLSVYHNGGFLLPKKKFVAGPVSFHLHAGEVLGLCGSSGSGKTSIGKALLDLIPTWEGEVYWAGRNIRKSATQGMRHRFGWVGQEPTMAFSPRRRIVDILNETLAANGKSEQANNLIVQTCSKMSLDPELLHRYPFELSGGQIQRCALVRVLMLDPGFVLLDEPTSSLDSVTQIHILDSIMEWRKTHSLAMLLISHSRELLSRMCHRVIALDGPP